MALIRGRPRWAAMRFWEFFDASFRGAARCRSRANPVELNKALSRLDKIEEIKPYQ